MTTETFANELTAAAGALAAIDLLPFERQASQRAADDAEIAAAIERGEARIAKIAEESKERERSKPDPRAAGDRLLGIATDAERATLADLEAERIDVVNGLANLRARQGERAAGNRALRDDVTSALAVAVEPLVAAIEVRANDIAARLAEVFAAAECVRSATGSPLAAALSGRLGDAIYALGSDRLIRHGPLAVPADLVGALRNGESAMRLAGRAVPEQARFPSAPMDVAAATAGVRDKAA